MTIGIFGGTFNPIHIGHAILANFISQTKLVNEVWLMPTPHNPLKSEGNTNYDRHRIEMAQIVAKAMARTDLDKADKATVDKLAAEFSEELSNLGVRVSDLEKKSDNIKWSGKLKYKYKQQNHDVGKDKRSNKIELRTEPKAYIGDSGWTANARIKYVFQPEEASNGDVSIERAYVQGPLFGTTVTAGLTPLEVTQGVLFDDTISGITTATAKYENM